MSDNCFFYVLSKFDNYFDKATVNLNCVDFLGRVA